MTEDLPSLGKAARRSCDEALAAGDLAIPGGPANLRDWRNRLVSMGAREIGLSTDIAMSAAELEDMHSDPFDRIIVATALAHDAALPTADRAILRWSGGLRRQDAKR
jgi:hypothetical protein